MKLYYVPKTRAARPRWMLEEIGVPYQLARLDPAKGETHTPEHLARHPLGHVPVLEDGQVQIFESAAICLYLADKYPERELVPPLGSPLRALCYQWIFYAVTEIEPPLAAIGKELRRPEAERDRALIDRERERLVTAMAPLERALGSGPYLLGVRFSVADVLVGTMLLLAKARGGTPNMGAVAAYLARLVERPAFQRASAD